MQKSGHGHLVVLCTLLLVVVCCRGRFDSFAHASVNWTTVTVAAVRGAHPSLVVGEQAYYVASTNETTFTATLTKCKLQPLNTSVDSEYHDCERVDVSEATVQGSGSGIHPALALTGSGVVLSTHNQNSSGHLSVFQCTSDLHLCGHVDVSAETLQGVDSGRRPSIGVTKSLLLVATSNPNVRGRLSLFSCRHDFGPVTLCAHLSVAAMATTSLNTSNSCAPALHIDDMGERVLVAACSDAGDGHLLLYVCNWNLTACVLKELPGSLHGNLGSGNVDQLSVVVHGENVFLASSNYGLSVFRCIVGNNLNLQAMTCSHTHLTDLPDQNGKQTVPIRLEFISAYQPRLLVAGHVPSSPGLEPAATLAMFCCDMNVTNCDFAATNVSLNFSSVDMATRPDGQVLMVAGSRPYDGKRIAHLQTCLVEGGELASGRLSLVNVSFWTAYLFCSVVFTGSGAFFLWYSVEVMRPLNRARRREWVDTHLEEDPPRAVCDPPFSCATLLLIFLSSCLQTVRGALEGSLHLGIYVCRPDDPYGRVSRTLAFLISVRFSFLPSLYTRASFHGIDNQWFACLADVCYVFCRAYNGILFCTLSARLWGRKSFVRRPYRCTSFVGV